MQASFRVSNIPENCHNLMPLKVAQRTSSFRCIAPCSLSCSFFSSFKRSGLEVLPSPRKTPLSALPGSKWSPLTLSSIESPLVELSEDQTEVIFETLRLIFSLSKQLGHL